VPAGLRERISPYGANVTRDEVDLFAEQHDVRETVKKNLYTGKALNSVANVQQFFRDRGGNAPAPVGLSRPGSQAPAAPPRKAPPIDNTPPWDVSPTPVAKPRPPVPVAPPRPTQGGLFGSPPQATLSRPPQLIPPVKSRTELPRIPLAPKRPAQTGTVIEHPKYGTGTIVRREGEGDDAKIVVSFQRHGLKKLVEKYAGLKKS